MVYSPFAAGQRVTAGDLNALIYAETMAWTPIASLGSFAANFSASTASVPRMRKLMAAGSEVWQFQGQINCSSWTANTVLTAFTLTSAYRVVTEREFAAQAANSAHYPVRLGFKPDGTITVSAPTAAGSGVSAIWIDCQIVNPLI